jgi:hypothetical protein
MDIHDFQRDWHVWWVDGFEPIVARQWKLAIGTEPGTEPFQGPDGVWHIGFNAYAPNDPKPVLSSATDGDLMLINSTLRWIGTNSENDEVRIYISLAEAFTPESGSFLSMYGTTLHGDPEQVAVWGANGGPPPQPVG